MSVQCSESMHPPCSYEPKNTSFLSSVPGCATNSASGSNNIIAKRSLMGALGLNRNILLRDNWPVEMQTCNSFEEMLTSRDVNFVFFQKSIIVLKKSIFFRLSNLGVGRYLAMPWAIM